MQVRQGSVQDWPFIFALGKIGISDSISPWRKQPMEETLRYREGILKGFWTWIEESGSVVFIAEVPSESGFKGEKSKRIGYLVLHPALREELTGVMQAWVMDLAVVPEWRGKGTGWNLIQSAEEYCRRRKIPYLGLAVSSHNFKALHLYEKFGFAEERKLMVKPLE